MNELQSAFWCSIGSAFVLTVIILIADYMVNSVEQKIESLFVLIMLWAGMLTIWFGNYHEILRGDCKRK